jgi:hypothetical protein
VLPPDLGQKLSTDGGGCCRGNGNPAWGGAANCGAAGLGAAGGGRGTCGEEELLPAAVELARHEVDLPAPFLPRRDVGRTIPSPAMSSLRCALDLAGMEGGGEGWKVELHIGFGANKRKGMAGDEAGREMFAPRTTDPAGGPKMKLGALSGGFIAWVVVRVGCRRDDTRFLSLLFNTAPTQQIY